MSKQIGDLVSIVPQHKHLIFRAKTRVAPTAHDAGVWVSRLVGGLGLDICAGPLVCRIDEPGNNGVTCVGILSTSHVALHTWEGDTTVVQLDLYSSQDLDIKIVTQYFLEFKPTFMDYKFLDRETGLVIIQEIGSPLEATTTEN